MQQAIKTTTAIAMTSVFQGPELMISFRELHPQS